MFDDQRQKVVIFPDVEYRRHTCSRCSHHCQALIPRPLHVTYPFNRTVLQRHAPDHRRAQVRWPPHGDHDVSFRAAQRGRQRPIYEMALPKPQSDCSPEERHPALDASGIPLPPPLLAVDLPQFTTISPAPIGRWPQPNDAVTPAIQKLPTRSPSGRPSDRRQGQADPDLLW